MSCNPGNANCCTKEATMSCNEDGVVLTDLPFANQSEIKSDWRVYIEEPNNTTCQSLGRWTTVDELLAKANAIPHGAYMHMDGDSDNGCWLLANGRSVTYQNQLDGSVEVITIGDARGRTLVMPDPADALKTGITAAGKCYGWAKSKLQINQTANHNHPINDPGHPHELVFPMNKDASDGSDVRTVHNGANQAPDYPDAESHKILTTRSSQTGISVAAAGGGQPHNNMQPSLGKNLFWNSCRPGWDIVNVGTIPTLIELTNANFDENNLSDPNCS